jgi:tetratricopeptide (TPR) repeat protein
LMRRWLVAALLCVAGLCLIWSRWVPSSVAHGLVAYQRQQWSEAFRLASERLRAAPDDAKALRLQARASARLVRFAEAQALYSRLADSDLEAEDYFLLGLGLSFSGRVLLAQGALERALVADPNHDEALYLLAVVAYDRAQKLDAARAAQRLAGRRGWEAKGDLLLGMVRASDNDPGGAVAALRSALRRDPQIRSLPSDPFSTQKLLARSLLQAARPSEAREVLKSMPTSRPAPEVAWLLSRSYLQEGDGARAAEALARSGAYRAEHPLEPEAAPYVGSTRCASCHRDIQAAVLASRHASTLVRDRDLAGLNLPPRPLSDPDDPQVSHALKWDNGRLQVETRVADKLLRAVVDYALGSPDRYISLVGRDDQGRLRTIRLSYHHSARESGWDRTKNQKPHPIRVDDFLGEPFASAQEAYECLICHTTSPRAVVERIGPESQDRGIGCEQCHGPGGHHLAAVALEFPDPAIASPAQASHAEINRLCGVCHSQDSTAIEMLGSHESPAWARFPSSTLSWSRCYMESGGALSCATCHDPHRNAETGAGYYEAKCLSCHATATASEPLQSATGAIPPADSAFRSPCRVNPSADCLRCHMPKVHSDWLHGSFTDHYIRSHAQAGAAGAVPPPNTTAGSNKGTRGTYSDVYSRGIN